ncbi:MAG: DUF2029 domain-containing protein [Candidatus Omnitrophota bacterium]|nr:MAG: DUF2029 domain-containing protein [Candidatus Omnitrophota bacterium]
MEVLRRHRWRVFLILFLFAASLGRYEHKMPKRNFADFHVYYYTAQKLAQRADIYDDNAYRQERVANFKYPPIVALVFYPFHVIPEHSAAVIWFCLNFIFIILFFYWASVLVFDKEFSNKHKNLVYFLAVLFTLRFFMFNFDEGQVNFLMMAALTLSLFLIKRGKDLFSGVCLGFSCLVKYMTAIIAPYILYKKKFKVFLYFVLAIFVFSMLPALVLGWDYNLSLQKSFFPFLCKTSLDFGSMSIHKNQSLVAMVTRFFSSFSEYSINVLSLDKFKIGFLVGLTCIFLYSLIFFPSRKLPDNNRLKRMADYGMLYICMALFNPNGWIHAFIFLVFPYMVCLYYLFKIKHQDLLAWILVFLSAAFCSWPDKLFIRSLEDSAEVYSFVTIGSLLLFCALCKIKFWPKEALESHAE